jgi:NAD(P)-dependent dehydrogenase (short-subunit alcohol dehydrogenase family)
VDILVNNAGISLPYGQPLWEIEARPWDLIMAINVKAPFLLTRLLLPSMISRRSGSIVNISSLSADTDWSVVPGPAGKRQRINPAYCVSKSALERLTISTAVHAKEHNIAVNALKPSAPTYSEGLGLRLRESDSSAWRSPYVYMTKAALFLARQDAGGVTGGVFLDEELCRRYQLA